jgi:ribose 5-phosphate isomerase B
MRIAVGSDHAGYRYKELVRQHLEGLGHEVVDFGPDTGDTSVDYSDYVQPAAFAVSRGDCDLGVVFGGSGNGEAIAANKVPGIRCGLCWDVTSARLTKEHNNANCISIGERMVSDMYCLEIVDAWLSATFEGGRHQRRIAKLEPPREQAP